MIYDLGLTTEQRKYLQELAAVKVKDVPQFYTHVLAWGTWKLWAIKDCAENETAGAFLYCDAGIQVQQNLTPISNLIQQRGYALWTAGGHLNQDWTTEYIYETLGINKAADNTLQLLTTVQGYTSRGIVKAKLIDTAFALASGERLLRPNLGCPNNYEQSLLSLLIAKYYIHLLDSHPWIVLGNADEDAKKNAIIWLYHEINIDVQDGYIQRKMQHSLPKSVQTELQNAAELLSTKQALNIAKAEEVLFNLTAQHQVLVEAADTLKSSIVSHSFHKDLVFQSFFNWLIRNFVPKNIVETGTFMGWTTEFIAQNYPFTTIRTIESNTYFYQISKKRLAIYSNVQQLLLNSEQFLSKWLPTVAFEDKCIFFLDAHWENYWPLSQEVTAISATQRSAIIIVDDFKVPGHSEYGYDDYGEGKVCDFSAVIPSLNLNNSYRALLPNYADKAEAKLAEHLRGRLILFQNADVYWAAALNEQWIKQHFVDATSLLECSVLLDNNQNLFRTRINHYFRNVYSELPPTINYTGITGKPPWEEIQEVTENKLHEFIGKTVNDIRRIVIVGGHLGFEIDRILQKYPNAEVHVFEASPRYFNQLSKRFTENSCVFCYNYAVSNENGTAIFYETTLEGNGSLFPLKTQEDEQTWIAPNAYPAERYTVSTVTLDSFAPLAGQLIDLLWVDVQGAEMKIFKGAKQSLRRCRALFLEVWTYKTMYEGQCSLSEMERYLAEHSFYLSSIGVDQECGVGNSFWLRTTPLAEEKIMLSEKPKKIVALIPARNESQYIAFCLRSVVKFADAICVLDDASDDNTVQVVESLAAECCVERIIKKQTWQYNETSYRQLLLDAGREIGGTHFIIIDADEAFTSNLAENDFLRCKILKLQPGERLEFAWIQLWRSVKQFRYDTSVWTNNYKSFIFADDSKCFYHEQTFHLERVPSNTYGKSYRIEGYKYGVLHFQFVNWRNLLVKQAWYRCLERIMHTQKSVQEINALYAPSKDETNLGLRNSPLEWFSSYDFFDEAIYDAPEQWREKQVLQWFEQYDQKYFAELDVWDVEWGSGVAKSPNSTASTLRDIIHYSITADEYEMVRRVESIGGWFSSAEILAIYRAVQSLPNNAKILEVGSYRGRSTNAIGYAMQGSARELYCLDIWRDFEQNGIRQSDQTAYLLAPNDYAIFEEFLRNSEWFSEQIRILRGSTKQFQEILPKQFFDLIFIDGAHDYENVFRDITVSLQCLKPGGIICGHDYHTDGGQDVIKAVHELILSNQRFAEHGVFSGTTIWFARYSESNATKIQFWSTASFKVSAIISTYNSEKFIHGCLQDLVEQTLYKKGKLEIIVIDSASEQNEHAIVQEFQARYQNIFYIRTLERETLYAAWNRGVQAARGQYITNANTDDRHRKDALEILSHVLDEHPYVDLVYSDCYVSTAVNESYDENDKRRIFRYPPQYFAPEALIHFQFGPQPMWRKSVHGKIGYFDESFQAAGDYDFNIRFALRGLQALHIADALGLYLLHQDAISTAKSNIMQYENARIAQIYKTVENVEKLYQAAGIPCDTPEERANVLLDMSNRLREYYPPWNEGRPDSNIPFAQKCFLKEVEIYPQSKHILLYTDDPGLGGGAHYNHSLLCGLAALGYKLTCVQSQISNSLVSYQQELGIQHLWLDFDTLKDFSRSITDSSNAQKFFHVAKPELVIFSNCCPLSNFAAKQVAEQKGIPYIVFEHCAAPYLAERFAVYLDELWGHYAQAKAVITGSTANLSLLHQLFKLPKDKGQVIYHGRAAQYFTPRNPSVRERLRQEFGIPANAVICFTAARLDAGKGYQYQMEAIKQLKQSPFWPQLYFVWAGAGPLETQLKAVVEQLEVAEKVKLLGECINVIDWLDASDIFVMPSEFESLGLAIIEAMAKGLPVIVSDVGGIPEAVGDTGKLVPDPKIDLEATVEQLVATIQAWSVNSELRYSIGQAGKRRVEEMFREERMVEETVKVIEDALLPDMNYLAHEFAIDRQQIAKQWLSLSVDQLENAYIGNLGKAHKMLLRGGIKDGTLTDAEQNFVNEIVANITSGLKAQKAINYLLAVMLYRRADKLPLQYELTHIPQWLLSDYLKYILDSPNLFYKSGDADNYCRYVQRLMDYFHTSIFSNQDSDVWRNVATEFSKSANFIPLYFNDANLKDIYVKRAEILEWVLKINNHEIDYEFADKPTTRKKIRLGILAAHFLPAAETFASLPVYEYISRDFEVILYSLNQSDHSLEQYCQSCANSFKLLPKDLAEQVNLIRADDLDILFIATNVTAVTNQICLLSLHRLGRMQVTSVGSVVTTGMRHVDYYISGQLTEPLADAQQHYREKLVKLEGTAHCFSYGSEQEKAIVRVDRESLGISEDTVIFISGANFFKITPELIDTWARIIAAVSNSVLVLLPFGPNWSNAYPKKAFLNHLNTIFSKHGIAADRLIVLDPQPVPNREDVKEYLKIADVYLDSYPFSGTTSLIEPLEVGLSIVSRQGNTFRSSMGTAMLQALNVPDLVADSEESYIKLAIALGTNPELRQQKSTQIKQKMQANPRFLDSRSYSAQMGALFQELFRKHQAITLTENFKLRETNLIIFPDWSQQEEILYQNLASVITSLVNHPDKNQTTLLIHTGNLSEDDANLLLAEVVMNLFMEEDLDVADGPEISLVGQLGEMQWEALLPCIQTRIMLQNENQQAIALFKAETIPFCELDKYCSTISS